MKPFFKSVPPFVREKIIYPYVTYYTMPLIVSKPKVLVLELSNLCNLNCKMCTRPFKEAPIGVMPLSLAKEAIRRAHDAGIARLAFHTVGEPLLYPYLKEVLTYAKDLGFQIGISANANLLTSQKSDMLLDIGLNNLRISLDGTGEIYNFIRERGNFSCVVKNIEYINKRRPNDITPRIKCNYVLTRDSIKCVTDFQKKYAYLFNEVTFCPVINQGYVKNEYVQKRSIILFNNYSYPCFNLWSNMYIAFDGDVSVCCVDYNHKHIVGNIEKDSLLNIWNSPSYQYYRKLSREGKINKMEFCKNCTMPVLISAYQMSRIGALIRRTHSLNIKILNKY